MVMSETMRDTMRAAAIAAVLLAGSCAAPTNDHAMLTADPDVNHPIVVEQSTKSMRLSFSAADAGLMPEDAARFDGFVGAYLASGGDASISITVPNGPTAQQTIRYFGERLTSYGVPRARILVGYRKDNDPRVELDYTSYTARTDQCGNWSQASDIASNLPMSDFGCSVQHNIAAQIDDPRDLVTPRAMGEADAVRRGTVMGLYQKGQPSQAVKKTVDASTEQSGVSSDVP
jgi:pilus assembly protein CpaD